MFRNLRQSAIWMVLVEEAAVFVGKLCLAGGKIGLRKYRVLGAEIGAAPTINALVGVDEDLGNAVRARVALHRRNGRRGALCHADKILDARVRDYISHEDKLLVRTSLAVARLSVRLSKAGFASR